MLDQGRQAPTGLAVLRFKLGTHSQTAPPSQPRISVLEQLAGQRGWLPLNLLALDSFQQEEHLVFTACTDAGVMLDVETCEKLFQLPASAQPTTEPIPEALQGNARRQLDAALRA